MPMPFRDKTGKMFGFWTVLGFAGRDSRNATKWKCKCICGNEKIVVVGSLLNGRSKSCGCKQYEMSSAKNKKHGMASTPTYKSWKAMFQRCSGKNHHVEYLRKNISVCKEWNDINVFISDMGLRPDGKTLDRIDNSKGYYKDNCRWATPKQQSNNRSYTVFVIVDDIQMPFMDACRKYGISESCARHRLRRGMSMQETFKKPMRKIKT